MPALAGLVIVAGVQMININNIQTVWQTNPVSRAIMVVTFVSTLLMPLQYAVLLGVILSILAVSAGLIVGVILVAVLFRLAVRAAQAVAMTREDLTSFFVASLVPIALAYSIAHYFTLLVNQGQFAIPLFSDPFGEGWDLFGTSHFTPSLFNSPNGIWYVQVGVLVIGHVLGLTLAHDRAVALWGSARTAIRTQYAMLALMVLYTCTGLWLLSAK